MDTFSVVLGFISIGFGVWFIIDQIIEFKKDIKKGKENK